MQGLAAGEPKIERNVIFGMYSGLALLMDVHYPAKPNGYGVVYIAGSGFHASQAYNASPLKQSGQVLLFAKPLTEAGYTVFAICHRAAPRFRYPAAVEDVQRAVRFIRHNAKTYGIRPDRIGATGGSSGGHLVSMLGVLDGKGDPDDPDPVNRESAKVQCVVARAAPTDLVARMQEGSTGTATIASFLGMRLPGNAPPNSIEARTYREASPVTHVSSDDPPMLLLHGDEDRTVPIEQSEIMEQALKKAGVEVKLLRVAGGGHGANFSGVENPPDYLGETVRWFDRHLRK
jgi:acetyl esterase/lipase